MTTKMRQAAIAGVSGDDVKKLQGKLKMENFEKWLKARGIKSDELEKNQSALLLADFEKLTPNDVDISDKPDVDVDAETKTLETPVTKADATIANKTGDKTDDDKLTVADQVDRALKSERERVRTIRVEGEKCDAELIDKLIDSGTPLNEARKELLADMRRNLGTHPAGSPQPADGGVRALEDLDNEMFKRALTNPSDG